MSSEIECDDDPENPTAVERTLTRADPELEAWCSFCCRPTRDVGPLTAGPAQVFICGSCTATSAQLLGAPFLSAPMISPPVGLLSDQSLALERYERLKPMVALIIGPEGVGKTELAKAMAKSGATVFDQTPVDESKVPCVIVVRGRPPVAALTLVGANGPEFIYDTSALVAALKPNPQPQRKINLDLLPESLRHIVASNDRELSISVLSKVDAVFVVPAFEVATLTELATSLLKARGIALSAKTIEQLVNLAQKSGRSAHELVALVARIPAGQYPSA